MERHILTKKTIRTVLLAACMAGLSLSAVMGQTPSDVSLLINRLSSTDMDERRDAARTLSKMGTPSQAAVGVLAKALSDDDGQVRSHALAALSRLGPLAEPAVPELIKALDHQDAQVRYRAAIALRQVGPAAVPALMQSLQNGSVIGQTGAARALAGIGPAGLTAVNSLINALANSEADFRDEAGRALATFGTESIERLMTALPDADASGRAGILLVFERVGPDANSAVPDILAAVEDEDPLVRLRAARALAYVAPGHEKLIPILGTLLADEHDEVSHTAGELFLLVGAQEAVVRQLAGVVETGDLRTVIRAADLLRRMGMKADFAVVPLTNAIVRFAELDLDALLPQALGAMGQSAVSGVLSQLSQQECSETVCRQFVVALTIVGREASSALTGALEAQSSQVRSVAALALGNLGESAQPALPQLMELLRDGNEVVRARAAEALGRTQRSCQTSDPPAGQHTQRP